MCALARRILHSTLCKPLPTRTALRMDARAAQPEARPEAPLKCGKCTVEAACMVSAGERGAGRRRRRRVLCACAVPAFPDVRRKSAHARSTRVRELVQCAEHEKTPVEHQVSALVGAVAAGGGRRSRAGMAPRSGAQEGSLLIPVIVVPSLKSPPFSNLKQHVPSSVRNRETFEAGPCTSYSCRVRGVKFTFESLP